MILRTKLLVGAVASLALSGTAHAASGITPLSPKAGATVPAGERPTFKMRVKGSGQVWVHVCRSKRKDSKGVICNEESIGRAKRGQGGVVSYKPRFFDYRGFWLNSPGTYYWQAYRIACRGSNTRDCQQESKITEFEVG